MKRIETRASSKLALALALEIEPAVKRRLMAQSR
jgi:hypothetical protein